MDQLLTASHTLDAALEYSDRGWAVFPCTGKRPLTDRGCHDATSDVRVIRQAWGKSPAPNIGIATGAPSGFWVLDIDGAEGEKSLTTLEAKYGKLPDTVVSITGAGGRHLLFRYHGERIRNRVGDIGAGLDVRATGGYIIAPPSIHPDTEQQYRWADGLRPDAMADAPAWLIDLACGKNRKQRERQSNQRTMGGGAAPSGKQGGAWAAKALEDECQDVAQTTKGGRNDQLNRAAFSLGQLVGGEELERGTVERALFAAAVQCGLVADDGEGPVLATIRSGLDGGIEQPRKRPETDRPQAAATIRAADRSAAPEPPPIPLAEFLSADHWVKRDIEPPEPLLGEVVTNTTRMFLAGPTGIGKTHIALAMAGGMASGTGYIHWRASKASQVLYIDGEMARDLVQERVQDLMRRMNVTSLPNLFVLCREDCEQIARSYPGMAEMPPLNREDGHDFILKLVELIRPDVIVFDNRMSLLSGDMKDEEPWSDTMPLVKQITGRRIAQIWIDHTGHSTDHVYGTKTKEWQFDTVGLMEQVDRPDTDIAFNLKFTKARRRKPSNKADFAAVTVTLTEDGWASDGVTENMAAKLKLNPKQCNALEALRSWLIDNKADWMPADNWRPLMLRFSVVEADSHRQRALDIRDQLDAKSLIRIEGGRVSLGRKVKDFP